jgi:arabinan endo-1,5-alpha-L-arabinosidase
VIGAAALFAFVPLLASAAPANTSKVRPTPPRQVDDSVHTGATAPWLRTWNRPPPGRPLPPYFEDVSVHDPAIIKGDGHYYIFGSHLAAARSDDLMSWQSIADGVSAQNPLFDNVLNELADTFAWAQSDTLWAPDVIRLGDGRYYMYYNACKGDSPRSALGVAVADKPEGPYRNLGILLRSGMWGQPSEDGRIYDALIHPNTVDPAVFFDTQGKLWMVYGSYSGGIFILQMDAQSGRPLPGQGYGKHLMGGNHSRIEGATVKYSPETGWYYLFTSFGGLASDGGYNVRVARSRNPDGPYLDGRGKDMAEVKSDPSLPLFDDVSIAPYAQKVIGNFLFDRKLGEPGTGAGQGYISPGHNSVYRDPRSGRWFLVFHTRFPGRGEAHQVRVHEMFLNDDGWPVVAPYRYAGQTARPVLRQEIAGDYKLVVHEKPISAALPASRDVTLSADGRVTGAIAGRWQLRNRDRLTLELDGGRQEGVLSWQWNETAQEYALTFTTISLDGVSLWGSRLPPRTTTQALNDILADIDLPATTVINLDLPTQAMRGASASWHSSDSRWIDDSGHVTRPEPGQSDRTVRLSATARLRGASATRTIPVTVRARRSDGLVAHYRFDGNLSDASGQREAGTIAGALIDAPGGKIDYVPGISGKAAHFDGASGIRLPPGLIQGNRYSVAFWFNAEALDAFTPTFFGARDGDHWISFLPIGHAGVGGDAMLWSGTAWYDAGLGMKAQTGRWTHVAFSVDAGQVRVYIDGQLRYSGSNFPDVFDATNGAFSLGTNWWDAPYRGSIDELRVYDVALDAAQVQVLAQP